MSSVLFLNFLYIPLPPSTQQSGFHPKHATEISFLKFTGNKF